MRLKRRCRAAFAAGVSIGLLLLALSAFVLGCQKIVLPPPAVQIQSQDSQLQPQPRPKVEAPPDPPRAPPPLDHPTKAYLEAYQRHMAPVDKWLRGVTNTARCYEETDKSAAALQVCREIHPPGSYLPKDRRRGETLPEYVRRKELDWAEQDRRYRR